MYCIACVEKCMQEVIMAEEFSRSLVRETIDGFEDYPL